MTHRRSNMSEEAEDDDEDLSLESAINKCVQYVISRESSKIPLKRADIQNMLTSTCGTPKNKLNSVLDGANKMLKQVYGYKLIQLREGSGIQFIVVLNQECESEPPTHMNVYHRRLLVAALTHIFMSGGPVDDDDMWKFLAEADLLKDNDFNGRKILTSKFTKQLYLTYTKVGEGDMARQVFEWGPRANEELPKIHVLQKMATAFNKDVDHWCEQHREATRMEEETVG